jgi:hypothetical protein
MCISSGLFLLTETTSIQSWNTIAWILNVHVPQKHLCGRFGLQIVELFGRWWNFSEVGPSGKKLGHWGCALEGDCQDPQFFFSLFLLPSHYEVARLPPPHTPIMMYSVTTGPTQWGQVTME